MFFARKHKKEPCILTPFEIWRRQAWYVGDILDQEGLNDFLGSLVKHAILSCNEELIRVECMECMYFPNDEKVCQAHFGIMMGLAEAKFGKKYSYMKQIHGTNCVMILEPSA